MGVRVGFVGLPNVGKSTLFNAVSSAGALAANYPFATVEPNVGIVAVPDDRLEVLARLAGSERAVPTTMQFVDIAGLVRGASRGEGLGNQFLAHIREVDAVCHVVRCFEDPEVVHVAGEVDPVGDVEVVATELALKDLETVERRLDRVERAARTDKALRGETHTLTRLRDHLAAGEPAREFPREPGDAEVVDGLFLLTYKPIIYAANVAESDLPGGGPLAEGLRKHVGEDGESEVVVVSAQVESELGALPPTERREYLATLGLERSGLDRLVRAAYRALGLVTFFTAGPKEARAWTVPAGTRAQRAAREVHTDMERGFIRAEVISYSDYAALGSEAAVREAGRMRIVGKEETVADGDVIHFRFNV